MIRKGRRSRAAARRLAEDGDHDFAVSRAYYAMFYLAEAMLLTRDLRFFKHAAVISAVAQHFVRPGMLATGARAARASSASSVGGVQEAVLQLTGLDHVGETRVLDLSTGSLGDGARLNQEHARRAVAAFLVDPPDDLAGQAA